MSKVWKFNNNVNTDEIIPGRFNITIIPEELAKNVFCEVRPDFAKNVQKGDVIVAGENFGCGSSREHAPIAIKASGTKCIIAQSFARIFFRNCINIGLPLLECKEVYEEINENDNVEVNIETGVLKNNTSGKQYQAQPVPSFVLKIAQAGGIIPFLREHEVEELQ
ncbi:3-isopropylmalate dehydratase [Candidatus Woesearchaeota archaeon CG10_big_fil_rev_8_21_14_0_10_34_8]|nr:MAG: 3-isopropylmalate dehydratase [Candidatus Woesearchaeota archaeon CG10_big_fil_rev_8_21_14_0_10_34_8]